VIGQFADCEGRAFGSFLVLQKSLLSAEKRGSFSNVSYLAQTQTSIPVILNQSIVQKGRDR
jgi:hypothetical protein